MIEVVVMLKQCEEEGSPSDDDDHDFDDFDYDLVMLPPRSVSSLVVGGGGMWG